MIITAPAPTRYVDSPARINGSVPDPDGMLGVCPASAHREALP